MCARIRRLAAEALADRYDPAIGYGSLLSDGMRFVVPASRLQKRDDELSAGIGFRLHGGLAASDYDYSSQMSDPPLARARMGGFYLTSVVS